MLTLLTIGEFSVVKSKDTLYEVKMEDAVITISDADYGVHCLVIYPDMVTLREFYSFYIQRQIEEKNEVVQLAPFYEREDSVRHILSIGHTAIDIEKYEKDGWLVIKDSLRKYYADIHNISSNFEADKKMIDYAKTIGKNGYSILGDMGAFIFKKRIDKLIDYELSLPKNFSMNMKGICLYNQKDFNQLDESQRKMMTEHHEMTIILKPH